MNWQFLLGCALLVFGLLILFSERFSKGFAKFKEDAHANAPAWEKKMNAKFQEGVNKGFWDRVYPGVGFTVLGSILILLSAGIENYALYSAILRGMGLIVLV